MAVGVAIAGPPRPRAGPPSVLGRGLLVARGAGLTARKDPVDLLCRWAPRPDHLTTSPPASLFAPPVGADLLGFLVAPAANGPEARRPPPLITRARVEPRGGGDARGRAPRVGGGAGRRAVSGDGLGRDPDPLGLPPDPLAPGRGVAVRVLRMPTPVGEIAAEEGGEVVHRRPPQGTARPWWRPPAGCGPRGGTLGARRRAAPDMTECTYA